MKAIIAIIVLLLALNLLLAQLGVLTSDITSWISIVLVAVIGILLLLKK